MVDFIQKSKEVKGLKLPTGRHLPYLHAIRLTEGNDMAGWEEFHVEKSWLGFPESPCSLPERTPRTLSGASRMDPDQVIKEQWRVLWVGESRGETSVHATSY